VSEELQEGLKAYAQEQVHHKIETCEDLTAKWAHIQEKGHGYLAWEHCRVLTWWFHSKTTIEGKVTMGRGMTNRKRDRRITRTKGTMKLWSDFLFGTAQEGPTERE
jgi:hypothetical protein